MRENYKRVPGNEKSARKSNSNAQIVWTRAHTHTHTCIMCMYKANWYKSDPHIPSFRSLLFINILYINTTLILVLSIRFSNSFFFLRTYLLSP